MSRHPDAAVAAADARRLGSTGGTSEDAVAMEPRHARRGSCDEQHVGNPVFTDIDAHRPSRSATSDADRRFRSASVSASADLFLPSADELATAEGDIADARDPTLTFTPNVLAADGFKRSRLTRRYVDAATERDFLAFVARDRWARVPPALLFVGQLVGYAVLWDQPFVGARRQTGWIVLSVLHVLGTFGALLSSAGVVDRLPWAFVRHVLSRNVRAFFAAMIIVVAMLIDAACFFFSENAFRFDRELRPSSDEVFAVHPPAITLGSVFFVILFPSRVIVVAPMAVFAAAVIVVQHMLRFFDGTDGDVLWTTAVVTAYLVGGLITFAWEEQQRAHFRARASAAWQAGRGAKLVELITDTCRRCKPANLIGRPALFKRMRPGGHRHPVVVTPSVAVATVIAFTCHFDNLTARMMLKLKADVVFSVGNVLRALELDAVVFGGCGDCIFAALSAARPGSAMDRLAANAVELGAILAVKLVNSLTVDEWGSERGAVTAGIASGPIQLCASAATATSDDGACDSACDDVFGGAAAAAARRLAKLATSRGSLVLSSDIVCRGEANGAASPDGVAVLAECFDLSPMPDAVGGHAVGSIASARVRDVFCRVETGLFFECLAREGAPQQRPSEAEHSISPVRDGVRPRRILTAEAAGTSRRDEDIELAVLHGGHHVSTPAGAGEDGMTNTDGAATENDAELVAADKAVSVKHVWRLLSGLTFEEDAVEARYRAQENAGATRHVVVFASAWYSAVVGAMYACRGLADTGTLVWIFFGLAVLSTAAMWAVLRPAKPGQRRWAIATVVLYPVQSVALLCALHFHPDPTNPAKVHQFLVSLLVAHVFIFTIPTTVPFVAALVVCLTPHWATTSWSAHLVTKGDAAEYWSFPAMAITVAFYGVLINAVRVRSRLAFADHVMSQRSAGRWARARRTLRRRLAAVVPAAVAEAAVLQLTARIGKARRGASYSAIDAALEEEGSCASSEDGLIRDAGGSTSTRGAAESRFSRASDPNRRVAATDVLDDDDANGDNDGQAGNEADADAGAAAGLSVSTSTAIRVPAAAVLVLDLRARFRFSAIDSHVRRLEGDATTPFEFSSPPGVAEQDEDLRDAVLSLPAAEMGESADGEAAETFAAQLEAAERSVDRLLRVHPYTVADAGPGLFVTRYGPCGWLVLAGAGRREAFLGDCLRQLREIACDVSLLPEVEACGGLRSGLATGPVAGDVFAVGTELQYEIVGAAVERAIAALRDGVLGLSTEAAQLQRRQ